MRVGHVVLSLVASCIMLSAWAGEETSKQAPLKGPFETDADGFILNWLIVGPFPNPGDRPDNKGFFVDYLKDAGGEANHVPANGMEIAGGGSKGDKKVKWEPYAQTSSSMISFFDVPHLKIENQEEDILTYSACWVEVEKDVDVEVRIGSDDAYKLWIDHKKVGEVHEYRSSEQDQEKYPMKLTAGKHLILIKVDQDYGGFEFMLRIVTSDGKKVPGIKVWN